MTQRAKRKLKLKLKHLQKTKPSSQEFEVMKRGSFWAPFFVSSKDVSTVVEVWLQHVLVCIKDRYELRKRHEVDCWFGKSRREIRP